MLSLDQETILLNGKKGWKINAWLYVPEERPAEGAPAVIMAQGFGSVKHMCLDDFAKFYAKNGFTVLAFDYRQWGESEGSPRWVLNIKNQIQDYFTAIDYVYSDLNDAVAAKHPNLGKVVDPKRIAIWGTSFSGGHVIRVGATYKHKERIKGIISMVPFADGKSFRVMSSQLRWSVSNAMWDIFKSKLGMKRNYLNIVFPKDQKGKKGRCVLPSPEAQQYWDIVPEGYHFENKVSASVGLYFLYYRPVKYSKKITTPLFGIYANNDNLCATKDAKKLFDGIPGKKTIHVLEGDHYEPYQRQFDDCARVTTEFLKETL